MQSEACDSILEEACQSNGAVCDSNVEEARPSDGEKLVANLKHIDRVTYSCAVDDIKIDDAKIAEPCSSEVESNFCGWFR